MTTKTNSRFRMKHLPGLFALLLPFVFSGSSPVAQQALTDPARIMATIREFSEFPNGMPKSRFCFRVEMDAAEVLLTGRMAEALGSRGTASLWPFPPKEPPIAWDSTGVVPKRETFYNVVGNLPGNQPGRGKFLVTSHFDAIGTRTNDWVPWLDPAPGSDDNMSGTAAVIEVARILAAEPELPFDVQFICFDGEELGLWGSLAFAAAESANGFTTPILGVLNMDMIGYNPDQDSLVIMSNRASVFLARYMVDSELQDNHPADFKIANSVNNLFISDQGPFWDHGIPGVLMIEDIRVALRNPQYHKITDRASTLSRDGRMIARNADVILKTLRRLAATASGPARVVTNDSELIYYVNRIVEPRVAVPGDSIRVTAGFMNVGGPKPAGDGTVRIYRINDGVSELLADEPLAAFLPSGGHTTIDVAFRVKPEDVGAITIMAEVGAGVNRTEGRTTIPVRGETIRVARHYMAPNPVRDPAAAHLAYELTGDATVRVSFYDMHGHELGKETFLYSGIPSQPGENAGPGLQTVEISDLLNGETAPGVYLYRIEVFPEGTGPSEVTTGKFAILR